jgi:subtilisin family serine protease
LRPAWSEAFDPPSVIESPGIPIDPAWALEGADGSGIRVAVIDSGVDHDHPAASGPHTPGAMLSWDREEQSVVLIEESHEDLFGHGTACAAIIRRTAPQCEIVSVRVLGERLSGKGEVFAEGLRWAIAAGARVLNLSLSTNRIDLLGEFYLIADEAAHAGAVLVCSMNNVPSPSYPSEFSSVISVAASGGNDPFEIFANPRPPADFGAPGIDVEVAWLGGATMTMTGNSFATPRIAGLAARILSKHPTLTPYQLKAVLRSICSNTGRTGSRSGEPL